MNINIVLLMDRAHICRAHRQVRSRVDSGMESLGNRRSIAKRHAPSVLFRLLAMWAGEGMRDGQGREEVASKAPIAQCPSHSRRPNREHDLRVGFRDAAHQERSRPHRLDAPAKRCSPTGGWPMLLDVGSLVELPPLSPRTGRLSCSRPFTALHQFSPHKRGRGRPVSSRQQVNNQGRSLP